MTRLTKDVLDAIIEALNFRLAGELGDVDDDPRADRLGGYYEKALHWAFDQRNKRSDKPSAFSELQDSAPLSCSSRGNRRS